MILYHGSADIVEYPEVRKAKYNKDFYYGFYCTQYLKQAERWATRYGKKGYINKYEYISNPDLNCLVFEKMKNIQVSALGAAVVAAYTVGIYETIDEAITHMVAVSEVFRPDMEIHRKYSRKYQCE